MAADTAFGVELSKQFEPSDRTPAPLVLMRCTAELEKRIQETGCQSSVIKLKNMRALVSQHAR